MKNLFDLLSYFFLSPPVFFCQFIMDVAVAFPLKEQFHHPFLM